MHDLPSAPLAQCIPPPFMVSYNDPLLPFSSKLQKFTLGRHNSLYDSLPCYVVILEEETVRSILPWGKQIRFILSPAQLNCISEALQERERKAIKVV